MTPFLDALSLLLVYSAIAIYAAAFVAYTLHLARRASTPAVPVTVRVPVTAGATSTTDPDLAGTPTAPAPDTAPGAAAAPGGGRGAGKAARVGFVLTVLGWVFHLAGVVLRGVAADRVPWANMFEFSLTGTALIIATFLAVSLRVRLAYLGSAVLGLTVGERHGCDFSHDLNKALHRDLRRDRVDEPGDLSNPGLLRRLRHRGLLRARATDRGPHGPQIADRTPRRLFTHRDRGRSLPAGDLHEVVERALQRVAQRGEHVDANPLRCLRHQSVHLFPGQVDAPLLEQRLQLGGLEDPARGHHAAEAPCGLELNGHLLLLR